MMASRSSKSSARNILYLLDNTESGINVRNRFRLLWGKKKFLKKTRKTDDQTRGAQRVKMEATANQGQPISNWTVQKTARGGGFCCCASLSPHITLWPQHGHSNLRSDVHRPSRRRLETGGTLKTEKLQRRSCKAACIDWLKGKTTRHGLMGHQRKRGLFGIRPSTQLEDNKMIWVCGKLHSVLLKSTICRYVGGTGTLCLGSSPLCSNSDCTGKCCLVIL